MQLIELYAIAKKEGAVSLYALIELVVLEKKTLNFMDDVSELDFYLQPKFASRMNELLIEYKARKQFPVPTESLEELEEKVKYTRALLKMYDAVIESYTKQEEYA